MQRIVAATNMTLDGFCDHTAVIPDEDIHHHYTGLLKSADSILYGRITYQLMEYWQPMVEKPTGNSAMDDFALAIDQISKIVFSHTLKAVTWHNSRIAQKALKDEVLELRQQPGNGILVGSPGLIISLMKLNLIDEYQICVHPVVVGSGLPLFRNMNDRIVLKLVQTKSFECGAIVLYYEPVKK